MKLVIYPAVEPARYERIVAAAPGLRVINAADESAAREAMADADAFFGKMTPALLAASRQLRWVQSPTASLEHYLFAELIDHPAVLTNMRGLYSDFIAEHVLGVILCFTRNLHVYLRNQAECRWGAGRRRRGARPALPRAPE